MPYGQEDSILRFAPLQVCLAVNDRILQSKNAKRCTRDPRFWSGSVRLKCLDFSRFLPQFALLFGSLKLSIFCLMLY